MYEGHFQFDRTPFANIPDPSFLYPSPEHEKALATLEYALISRTGFCVITGDVGAGKTTLVRHVLQNIEGHIHVGLVSNTQCETFDELLRWILLAFDLEYKEKGKVEMYDDFVQFLIRQHEVEEPVTLIIDEAQNLSIENLEQLRMLSNVNSEKGQLLQTILVGQPELWDLLHNPALVQFAQRISHDYFLKPLGNTAMVEAYVKYRLRSAGGKEDLFEPGTFELIWHATKGVPRLINLVCDTALVFGYGDECETISVDVIKQVIEHKRSSFSTSSIQSAFKQDQKETTERLEPKDQTSKTRKLSVIERAAQKLNNKI